ncbi:hypothetical protein SFC08_01925 [Lysinibacillus halotolerans]
MFKMYKAKFKTSFITTDDIRKTYNFAMPKDEVLELQAKAHRDIDGIEIMVAEWNYSPGNFSILGHNEVDDSKLKELIWSIEQGGGFYCDDRERFDEDWAKGEYDPGGALHFEKELFEVIEFVKEVKD